MRHVVIALLGGALISCRSASADSQQFEFRGHHAKLEGPNITLADVVKAFDHINQLEARKQAEASLADFAHQSTGGVQGMSGPQAWSLRIPPVHQNDAYFQAGNPYGSSYEVPFGTYSSRDLLYMTEVRVVPVGGEEPLFRYVGLGALDVVPNPGGMDVPPSEPRTLGWSFERGGVLLGQLQFVEGFEIDAGTEGCCPPIMRCRSLTRYYYVSRDRVIHFQRRGIENTCQIDMAYSGDDDPEICIFSMGACPSQGTEYWSTDGQIKLDVAAKVITYPDGSRELFEQGVLPGSPATVQNEALFSIPQGRTSSRRFGVGATSRVIDANGNTTRYLYDASGNLSSVVEPDGRTTLWRRDALGNVIEIEEPGPGGQPLIQRMQWTTLTWEPAVSMPDLQCLRKLCHFAGCGGEPIACPARPFQTLSQLTLPDGRSYQFSYQLPGGATSWGALTRVTGPDGAVTDFHYGDASTTSFFPATWFESEHPAGMPTLLKRRLTKVTTSPSGAAGDTFERRIEHEASKQINLLSNFCRAARWTKVVRPDGMLERTAICVGPLNVVFLDVQGSVLAKEIWEVRTDGSEVLRAADYYGRMCDFHGTTCGAPTDTEALGTPYVTYEMASWLATGSVAWAPGGRPLDMRPTKTVHYKDGVWWTERFTYDQSDIAAHGGTLRTLGNVTAHTIVDQTGATRKQTTKTFHHVGRAPYVARNLIRLPSSIAQRDGSTVLSRIDYRYDESPIAASGAPNLDTSIGTERGNVTSTVAYATPATAGGGVTTTTTYYDTGAADVSRDARGSPTTHHHDFAACSPTHKTRTTTVRNALHHPTTTVTDCFTDATLSVTDANGQRTCTQYDRFGRVAALVGPGDSIATDPALVTDPGCTGGAGGPTSTTEYPPAGSPMRWSVHRAKDGTTDGHQERTFRDGLGRTIQTCAEVDPTVHPQGWVCDRTEYDGMDRAARVVVPFYAASVGTTPIAAPAAMQRTRTTYDALGRDVAKELVGPLGQSLHRTTTSYGSTAFTLLDGGAQTGFSTTITDPNGNVTRSVKDLLGHVVETHQEWGSCPNGFCVTRHKPDAIGRVTKIRDAADHDTLIEIDGLGNRTAITDPDMGRWEYAYDANGNLTRQIDAKGQVTTMQYDALDRVTLQDLPPGGPGAEDVVTTYDGVVPSTCHSCDDRCASTVDACDAATLTCTHTGTPCDPPAAICNGCQTLNAAGDACVPLAAGLEGHCPACQDCDGAGACRPVELGHQDVGCDAGPAVCSAADSCDGNGACRLNHLAPDTEGGCPPCQDCKGDGTCKFVGPGEQDVGCSAGPTACSAADSCDGGGGCSSNHLPPDVEGGCPPCQDCRGDGECKLVTPGHQDVGCNAGATPCSATDVCAPGGVCNFGDTPTPPCYRDADGDGFGAGPPIATCGGCNPGDVPNNLDCFDQNANARPGQTACFSSHRGDFSFDYNCSGNSTRCGGPPTFITSCSGGGSCPPSGSCSTSSSPTHDGHCGQQVPVACGQTSCGNGCQIVGHALVACQ